MHINVAGVQFGPTGKIYDFAYQNLALQVGDEVLVDSEKGNVVARVAILKFESSPSEGERRLKSIIRLASQRDYDTGSYPGDDQAKAIAQKHMKDLKLKMQTVACQLQLGSQKIVIYFTSPSRVDFRELVKLLAADFRARIELRQISSRDETKLVGGVGICGRAYCCSSLLREFVPVSIKMTI